MEKRFMVLAIRLLFCILKRLYNDTRWERVSEVKGVFASTELFLKDYKDVG